jgi:hypothetical protein
MASYERALETLYQAPLAEFVSLRGRLATEMRAAGDRPAAGQLGARRRPTISAWTVNQLYWRARRDFDTMRAAAERLRGGDLDATADYRGALATLRRRAAEILREAGHAVSDTVLGRVANTLAAVAVVGFEPDVPGTLAADRDPPGFDIGNAAHLRRTAPTKPPGHDASRRERAAEHGGALGTQRRVTELAEKRREAQRAQQVQQRRRLERELVAARADLERREKALARAQGELRTAEEAVEQARAHLQALEHSLARSDPDR